MGIGGVRWHGWEAKSFCPSEKNSENNLLESPCGNKSEVARSRVGHRQANFPRNAGQPAANRRRRRTAASRTSATADASMAHRKNKRTNRGLLRLSDAEHCGSKPSRQECRRPLIAASAVHYPEVACRRRAARTADLTARSVFSRWNASGANARPAHWRCERCSG